MNRLACQGCNHPLLKSRQRKYCSNQCQADSRYNTFISRWLATGRIPEYKNTSRHIRRYLVETFGDECSLCGWCKKNPVTKRVPLEVDHVDGNSQNNKKENLRLLCPNCHSLTPSFRALNWGNGRKWRTEYISKRKNNT